MDYIDGAAGIDQMLSDRSLGLENEAINLRAAARIIQWILLAASLVGVIVGIVLILHTDTTDGVTTSPDLAYGVGFLIGSAFNGLLNWTGFALIRLVASYVSFRAELDIQNRIDSPHASE